MYIESLDFVKDKVSESDFILFNNIEKFLESIDYTDHQDELEYLLAIIDNIESPYDTLNNLFALHLNKLGSFMGLDFNVDSKLSSRLELIKVISNIPDIDKNILIATRDDFNILESHYDKLDLLYKDLTDSILTFDIYELVSNINPELIDYLNSVLNFKEERNMEELIEESKMNIKLKPLKELKINKDMIIYEYFKNNPDHTSLETVLILFREYIEEQTYDIKSTILTILLLSEGDIYENYDKIISMVKIKTNLKNTIDLIAKVKI